MTDEGGRAREFGVIIPARYASKRWVGVYAARPALVLQPSTLPERTTVVFAGALGRPMGELLHLPAVPQPLEP